MDPKFGFHDEVCPFKKTLWSLPDRSFSRRLKRSPNTPSDLSLQSTSLCQTLSKAFDISEKTDLTSRGGLQSNASNNSCVVTSNWFMQESEGWEPEWLGFNRSSSNRKLLILLKITFSNIYQRLEKQKLVGSFQPFVCHFVMNRDDIRFFPNFRVTRWFNRVS